MVLCFSVVEYSRNVLSSIAETGAGNAVPSVIWHGEVVGAVDIDEIWSQAGDLSENGRDTAVDHWGERETRDKGKVLQGTIMVFSDCVFRPYNSLGNRIIWFLDCRRLRQGRRALRLMCVTLAWCHKRTGWGDHDLCLSRSYLNVLGNGFVWESKIFVYNSCEHRHFAELHPYNLYMLIMTVTRFVCLVS